jgi:hypothetical protein
VKLPNAICTGKKFKTVEPPKLGKSGHETTCTATMSPSSEGRAELLTGAAIITKPGQTHTERERTILAGSRKANSSRKESATWNKPKGGKGERKKVGRGEGGKERCPKMALRGD